MPIQNPTQAQFIADDAARNTTEKLAERKLSIQQSKLLWAKHLKRYDSLDLWVWFRKFFCEDGNYFCFQEATKIICTVTWKSLLSSSFPKYFLQMDNFC